MYSKSYSRTCKRLFSCLLLIVWLIPTSLVSASVREVTVNYTLSKAPKVGSGKTYIEVGKSDSGYVTFTAARDGNYKIAFSSLKAGQSATQQLRIFKASEYGFSTIAPKYVKEGVTGLKMKQSFMLTNDKHLIPDKHKQSTCHIRRWVNLKLAKGDKLYIYFSADTKIDLQTTLEISLTKSKKNLTNWSKM